MKKIFTLAAAVLASFSLWAADAAAPATKTYGDITFLDVAGTDANRTDKEGKDYLTYGVYYVAKTKAITTWFNSSDGSPASNHESSGYSITDAEDFGFFPTSSTSTDINYGGTKCHSGRQRYFYVTGATSVAGIVRDGGTSSNKYAQMLIQTVAEDGSLGTATTIGDDYVSASAGYVLDGGELDPAKYYKISFTSPVSSNSYMYQIRLGKSANCTDPEAVLTFNKSTAYVGDQFSYNYSSKNGGALNDSYTLNGDPAVQGTDYTFSSGNLTVLKAGQFVMHRTVDAEDGYCAVDVSDTILINAATPVASVTIDGPATGFVGQELTYTATAEGATAYQWLVDGVDANTNAATFKYTAVKGTHSIVCEARNEFNATDEWIASEAKAVTVTKLCGELIKATTGGTVTGVVGGTYDTNNGTGDTKKLDKKKYYGIKLASGTFMAGDVFTINVTTAAGSGKCMLYADKNGSELIVDAGSEGYYTTGELTVTLPAAANGKDAIYLYREDGNTQWNPTFSWISVTRACEESDNNNATVTINGDVAEKSGTVFNYTLSASYDAATVAVEIALEHPLATLMEDHAASFTMATPEVGTPTVETFKVKAENGEQAWYSIFVNKSAALNNDATLKALEVEGYTLTPAFDAEVTAYTITKAYGAENPAVEKVTATPNDGGAKGAEVVLAGDVYTITVTAEDNTTTKEYTITVNEAAARKSLLRATFSNGVHGFIAAGNIQVPYLAGEAEPTFVSATFWQKDGDPTAAVEEGKLVVTGADGLKDEYTLEFVALTPKAVSYEEETFTAVPSYIFSVYGWDDTKGVKFSKDAEEASNHRISEGKDRIYIALPAAKEVKLTAGVSDRPIEVTVNGVVDSSITKTGNITISLNSAKSNLVGIESNGSNGDAGFTKLQLVEYVPTALDNTEASVKATKRIVNGQLFIEKNGVMYNAQGAVVR